ncbi:glycosyltransferase involved in cell wall biosynthesis [Acinetobacter baylyi]|uniref:Glycosyltransferase involved in cell wall biosynthesis n=2 Tax=Acinetobacter baylyi TaxID=202950 RepID=A0ABU0UZ11_ACIBI|nr:glycosyltransferase family 4 protein [Acinetobacter baylyi]MDQ1209806.1 glycosyltransferase involved in cell wall biosynthesis [Acinetobacter baylyi]MDR6186676.1 glycosyltransferase involved in cell wall biosynthesis [Acinetobacter baylyi]
MVKVGLIIDEFFGGAGTAFGGYGFLAREYIAKYIPNEDIQVDVLLGKGSRKLFVEEFEVDNIMAYRLPRRKWFAKRWLKKKNYDVYLSVELTDNYVLINEPNKNKKLILWIQDPRPHYEWDEINTVKLFPEYNYYNQSIYDLVHDWYTENRIKFISQGYFLNQKAIDLYNLDQNVNIEYMPNPIQIDHKFNIENFEKKNMIIFLGRIESVKRGWLFCEIAKKMPNIDFYVLGKTHREESKNSEIMSDYYSIPNLSFVGHVEGEEKIKYLKEAKILVNTSIHEALPISFLEALSYGTLLVSNRNPEDLTSKFGIHVGDVLGDGFDKIDLYVNAIHQLLNDEENRKKVSSEAISYIKNTHDVDKIVPKLRNAIIEQIQSK